jgi:hypothetical protein
MSRAAYQSDQKIADAYGIPYLFDENSEYVMEDKDVAFNRVVKLHEIVTKWIEKHRRIPSCSPNADVEERKIAIWLKVIMFYKEVILDPNDQNEEERISNQKVHEVCQHLIRYGEFPDEYEGGIEDE